MIQLMQDQVIDIKNDESLALPPMPSKSRSFMAQLVPSSGNAIEDASVSVSNDGDNWSKITDDEGGDDDEVVDIQVRDIPGRFVRVTFTSSGGDYTAVIN